MQLYNGFHFHSELSNGTTNIDSITNFREYIPLAKECGMTAFGISEHGNLFEWVHKKEAIEAAGMKYLHCVEAYITEDTPQNCSIYSAIDMFSYGAYGKEIRVEFKGKPTILEDGKNIVHCINNLFPEHPDRWIDQESIRFERYDKTRDNYHCVLIAKNYDGVKELNKMMAVAWNRGDCHFYFVPRITMEELFDTSDNIIVSSACLGSALNSEHPGTRERFLNFLRVNKHRCFLEIQHHNCDEQREYNKFLYKLHLSTGIPLIVGTDTHALNDWHMAGRSIMQKSKAVRFGNEDAWDLTFKTPEQLIESYKKQGVLPIQVVYEAMENTLRMSDMVDEFTLDHSKKYPKLYENSEEVFKQKINNGVLWRGINKYPNKQAYFDRIHEEYETYNHNGAIDFMLLEEDYKSEMRRRGVNFGYSRGSVSGSVIAYLLGITDIDSVKYHLNFQRFMNSERVSLADVDTDWYSGDRKTVKDYLYNREGLYCCDIVTFNTIALKGAINDICRGFYHDNLDHLPETIKKEYKDWDDAEQKRLKEDPQAIRNSPPLDLIKRIEKHSIHKDVPFDYLRFSTELNKLAEQNEDLARDKYPEIFQYVDLVNGCVVSVGNHPAGCVVSPFPVDEWMSTFTTKTNEYPISVLNMKEVDSLNFVKLDILG